MRSFSFLLSLCALACAVSCGRATLTGTVCGEPQGKTLLLKQSNDLKLVDSLVLASDGKFDFKPAIGKGEREFFYLYMGKTKLASLILSAGDKVSVECDTLGNWSVEGSQECTDLLQNEKELALLENCRPLTYKDFTEHYRKMVKYIYSHPKSLTTIPVFFQKVQGIAVFGLPYDGVLMGNIADSLETVYPDSPYLALLRTASKNRLDALQRNVIMNNAETVDFPDLEFADVNGEMKKLSETLGKKTLLVFWTASQMANKFYNQDVLLPLYQEFEQKGLEIYQVCLSSDVAPWKLAVRQQNLPWVNVYDATNRSAGLYGVDKLPTVFKFEGTQLSKIEDSSLEGIKAALK